MLVDLLFSNDLRQNGINIKLKGKQLKNPASKENSTRKVMIRPLMGREPWRLISGWRRVGKGVYFGPPNCELYLSVMSKEQIDDKWAPQPSEPYPLGTASTVESIYQHLHPYIAHTNPTPFILVLTRVHKKKLSEPFQYKDWGIWAGEDKPKSNILNADDKDKIIMFRLVPLKTTKR